MQPLRGVSIRNQLPVQVMEVTEESGAYADVRLSAAGATLLARVTRLTVHELGLRAGLTVYALVKSAAIDRHSLGLTARAQSSLATTTTGASSFSNAAI